MEEQKTKKIEPKRKQKEIKHKTNQKLPEIAQMNHPIDAGAVSLKCTDLHCYSPIFKIR